MNLYIEKIGHGPPLVMLHGWAMHSGVFLILAERLSQTHTLYLVDLPGHGHSRDSDIPLALNPVTQTLLDTLPPAIWIGWSLGGLFALHAAVQTKNLLAVKPAPYPPLPPGEGRGEGHGRPKMRALIMLCSTPCFVRQNDWPHGMPPETFATFATGLHENYRHTLDRFIALETLGTPHAKDELRTLRELLYARGEPAPHALSDGLTLLHTLDLRPVLPHLNLPTLWLSARRDRLVHPHAMQTAATLTPNAHLITLEHAGHAPMLTHADSLAEHILRFTAALSQ